MEFDIKLLSYKGDDLWVEKGMIDEHKCLMNNEIPDSGEDCDFCKYRKATDRVEKV